jgi:hypothetical protein
MCPRPVERIPAASDTVGRDTEQLADVARLLGADRLPPASGPRSAFQSKTLSTRNGSLISHQIPRTTQAIADQGSRNRSQMP